MKRLMFIIVICTIIVQFPMLARSQANEAAQLALNVEKLAQLKSILTTLKKGFTIVSTGYGTIKSLSEGNFNLHKVFLDGLLQVSPAVKKYHKIAGIIDFQIQLIRECKSATQRFNVPAIFNSGEINYLFSVYENLGASSLKNLDELLNVVTAGSLRMSDDERLSAIDKIYLDMEDKLSFVRNFNSNCAMMAFARKKEKNQIEAMERLSGIKNLTK